MELSRLNDIPKDATPLIEEDLEGLIPSYLATRDDLNLVEAENIMRFRLGKARRDKKYRQAGSLLRDSTVRQVHKEMFGDVWKWAGIYRKRLTNIGVMPEQIPVKIRELCLNTQTQIDCCDKKNARALDEIAVRFHWDLVRIHPFPNGNGRHARMMADLLVSALGRPLFTWGASDLVEENNARGVYISALRKADETLGDVSDLLAFARS